MFLFLDGGVKFDIFLEVIFEIGKLGLVVYVLERLEWVMWEFLGIF